MSLGWASVYHGVDGCKGGGSVPGLVAVKLRRVTFPLWWKGWLVAAGSGVVMCVCVCVSICFRLSKWRCSAFPEGLWGQVRDFNMLAAES